MMGDREIPEVEYISSCKLSESECFDVSACENAYRSLYFSHHDREIAAGATLWGIHKDDMEIYLNRNRARFFASQGQQRSAVLALLLSKTELIKNQSGKAPIVLLDDVTTSGATLWSAARTLRRAGARDLTPAVLGATLLSE